MHAQKKIYVPYVYIYISSCFVNVMCDYCSLMFFVFCSLTTTPNVYIFL